MKADQKKKVITLILTIAVLAVAGAGAWVLTHGSANAPMEESVQSEGPASGPEQSPNSVQNTPSAPMQEPAQSERPDSGSEQPSNSAQDTPPVPASSTVESVNDSLILVRGGTFIMGSPTSERQHGEDETAHEVTVSDFYADPCEVTQADYERIMGVNPSHFSGDDLPVDNVTWYDAIEYCNRLSESRGLTPAYTVYGKNVSWNRAANGYRLLTEAEWEYAAKAGTTTIFNAGNQITSDDANFHGSYPYLIEENYVSRRDPSVVTSNYRGKTITVDSLSPNQFGLYNMYGNVSEWCFDYYGAYDLTRTADPAGAVSGSLRVNRGGSYIDFAKHLRSAYRSATNPEDPDQNLGFRIARNAQAGEGTVETTLSLNIQMPDNPQILIAYFSYSGNTENAARIIRDKTGADLVEIEMESPYRGNIYEVSQADLNNNVHPALRTHIDNMDEYDVILLGYPTWWATMPMPVVTFLESYNFDGKIVISFSSHGGTMFGDSVSDLSKMIPGAYVGQGFEFNYSGGSGLSGEISHWLALNGIREW